MLGRLLPPDTVDFATHHAEEYGVEPFHAIERLVLLPPESLASARQTLTALGVEALCGLSGDVLYAFVAPADGVAAELGIEPLGLLAACFLTPSQRERAARSVAAFEYAALSVDAERARRLLPTLNGSVRAVLEALVRSPGGVQSLRERNLVPNAELVAVVCALWITREIGAQSPAAATVFPPPGAAPRPSVTPPRHSVPPFVQATSSMPPARRNSGFIRADRGPESGAKEHAMEQKVEEAWMRAEADPSRAHEITAIVNKAIGVFPKNPRLHYFLARLHIQANRAEEAVTELERVLELDPRDAQAQAELARLRARLGSALDNG